mmetsp:Transcript_103428/g.179494  ORF Transcript_103428/g.179494 Transcript_103428/m.179494 type:complete len:134 (-) Transcript_103428:126-527(-)
MFRFCGIAVFLLAVPSDSLECTEASGDPQRVDSLGKVNCTSPTDTACFQMLEEFGGKAILTQSCDHGICERFTEFPETCCKLTSLFLTQKMICSRTDFKSIVSVENFANCTKKCAVTSLAEVQAYEAKQTLWI